MQTSKATWPRDVHVILDAYVCTFLHIFAYAAYENLHFHDTSSKNGPCICLHIFAYAQKSEDLSARDVHVMLLPHEFCNPFTSPPCRNNWHRTVGMQYMFNSKVALKVITNNMDESYKNMHIVYAQHPVCIFPNISSQHTLCLEPHLLINVGCYTRTVSVIFRLYVNTLQHTST
jgi:hypothetical protein